MRGPFTAFLVFCLSVSGQLVAGPAPTKSRTVTPTPSITLTFTVTLTSSVTPTPTDTPICSPTPSPTAGEGSYTLSQTLFVTGSQGNGLDLVFVPGAAGFPSSGGLLSIFFPLGFTAPNADNCFVHPAQSGYVIGSTYDGQWAHFELKNVPAGLPLTVRYGMNSTGFTMGSTLNPDNLVVYTNPLTTTDIGGLLTTQPTIVVQSPTCTVTPSITLTLTDSPTPTVTPTSSHTPTITQTFTETPIAALQDGKVFAYPNPYDMRRFNKVTFRFPEDHGVLITVFNLLGHPVREIPVGDINESKGWAVWSGTDDYNRQVNGGVYLVRVRGQARVLVKRFTVLR